VDEPHTDGVELYELISRLEALITREYQARARDMQIQIEMDLRRQQARREDVEIHKELAQVRAEIRRRLGVADPPSPSQPPPFGKFPDFVDLFSKKTAAEDVPSDSD